MLLGPLTAAELEDLALQPGPEAWALLQTLGIRKAPRASALPARLSAFLPTAQVELKLATEAFADQFGERFIAFPLLADEPRGSFGSIQRRVVRRGLYV